MNIADIARVIDLLALSTVWGATVWFFFVQSPVLLRRMGRESFVPLQMRLTRVLFDTLSLLLLVLAGATALHSALNSAAMLTAGVALLGGLVNKFIIVPRALKAGGQSRAEIKGKDGEQSVGGFASLGAGNRTKRMHRLVVAFVVVMLAGTVGHGIIVLGR